MQFAVDTSQLCCEEASLFGQFSNDSFKPVPAGVAVVMFLVIFFIGNHLLEG
jgi:hypothetical protein